MKWCAGVAVRAAVQDLRVFTTACSTLVSYTTYVLVLVLGLFAHSYNSLPGFPFPSILPLARLDSRSPTALLARYSRSDR
jgi:hypothetical protein